MSDQSSEPSERDISDDLLPEELQPTGDEPEERMEPGSLDLPDGAFTGDGAPARDVDEESGEHEGGVDESEDREEDSASDRASDGPDR